MHSLIFDTVRDMVVEKYGEAAWQDLANKSSLPHTFETDAHFNDDLIYELLKHASEALKTPVDTILELVGYWFVVYVKKSPEYANLLNMAGNSLAEILSNINSFHGHMKLSYFKNICPPTFRTTNVTSTSLRLHYIPGKPNRKGLSSLVVGIIKAVAEIQLGIQLSKLKIVLEKSALKGADHDIFYVSWRKLKEEKVAKQQPAVYNIGLDGDSLNSAFPFHFIINKKLQIIQSGSALRKLIDISPESLFTNKFELVSPKIETSFKLFQRNMGDPIILRVVYDDRTIIDIHGEFLNLKEKEKSTNSSLIIFVGSPMFKNTKEVAHVGLSLTDFAVHDPAKDRLFAYDAESTSNARLMKRIVSDTSYQIHTHTMSDSDDSSLSVDFTDVYNGSGGSNNVTFDKKAAHVLQHVSSCPMKSVMPRLNSEIGLSAISKAPSTITSPRVRNPILQQPPTEKQDLIIDLLLKDSWSKFEFTKSVVELSMKDPDHKSFIFTLTELYTSLNRINDLVTQSVRWELSVSNDPNQMMRQDSVSTAIISSYSKRLCEKVLKNLLLNLVSELHQLSKEDLEQILHHKNPLLVEHLASRFLTDLCDSVSNWPTDFSKLLSLVIQEASNVKDDGFKFAHCTINSILFLRLISPAISFPDKFNIAPSAKLMEYQPILVTISRLINNLATGKTFDDYSQMAAYNSFVTSVENQTKLSLFMNTLIDNPGWYNAKKSASSVRQKSLSANYIDDFNTYLLMRLDDLFEISLSNPTVKSFVKELVTAQLRSV